MKTQTPLLFLLSLLFSLSLGAQAANTAMCDGVMSVVKTDGSVIEFTPGEVERIVFDVTKQASSASDDMAQQAVDLGLSVKWANMNVGAQSPEDYGGYYAWGETKEKEDYSADTYLYYENGYKEIGEDICGTKYDVARTQWGGNWRMPTITEFQELSDSCTWTWTALNDVYGYKVTGKNGNSIFLPAAGCRWGTNLFSAGSFGDYWSSSYVRGDRYNACYLYFGSDGHYTNYYSGRKGGQSVRPVCPK